MRRRSSPRQGSHSARSDEDQDFDSQPRKVFIQEGSAAAITMDSRTRTEVEQIVEAALQSQMIQRYEEEVRRMTALVAEKDETIVKLTRENGELKGKVDMQQALVQTLQTRLDKVDAVISVHDKAIVSVKDNLQGVTFRLASMPMMDGKDNQRQAASPLLMNPPMQLQKFGNTRGVAHIPSEPVSVALVGDTTFRYIDEEHLFQKSAKCMKTIVSSIDDAKALLAEVLHDRPTCIVFHLGTKDVEYSNSDMCAQKMQELVHLTKEISPETQVCISLLLPRSDSEPNKVKAQLYNFKVQETLAHEGVNFIIHSEFEKDGRLVTKYYQPDYININGLDGSRKLAAHLKHGIRKAVPALQPVPIMQGY